MWFGCFRHSTFSSILDRRHDKSGNGTRYLQYAETDRDCPHNRGRKQLCLNRTVMIEPECVVASDVEVKNSRSVV